MKERPILFNGPMVRALLDGSKTQTRRVVKLPHLNPLGKWEVLPWGGPNGGVTREGNTVPFQNAIGHSRTGEIFLCPYGQPGDRFWVRETFSPICPQDPTYNGGQPIEHDYAATYKHGDRLGDTIGIKKAWKPSIHMPRTASRITLEITGVRVERLQDISDADALAEGVHAEPCDHIRQSCADIGCWGPTATGQYGWLWDSINGPGSWDANPWVWAIEFKRITA